jgi:hypothetical protein
MFPKCAAQIMHKHITGRWLNLRHPQDLNEKINYMKFHDDMVEWAKLADKYEVREYVKWKGLDEVLVPLYGKYDNSIDLINDWNRLPQKFVVKSNNSCAKVVIIEDKTKTDLFILKTIFDNWLKVKPGVGSIEPHYRKIKPCLIVEELLQDNSVAEFSQSLIDYKIWCFNGDAFCILVAFDRHIGEDDHHLYLDVYDLNWNRIEGAMSEKALRPRIILPKPLNLSKMVEIASTLSNGQKQVRVDLYNIDGRVYFGEMTLTSQGGYMDYFTPDFLLEMGSKFDV